jgi:hypothetical protein
VKQTILTTFFIIQNKLNRDPRAIWPLCIRWRCTVAGEISWVTVHEGSYLMSLRYLAQKKLSAQFANVQNTDRPDIAVQPVARPTPLRRQFIIIMSAGYD